MTPLLSHAAAVHHTQIAEEDDEYLYGLAKLLQAPSWTLPFPAPCRLLEGAPSFTLPRPEPRAPA